MPEASHSALRGRRPSGAWLRARGQRGGGKFFGGGYRERERHRLNQQSGADGAEVGNRSPGDNVQQHQHQHQRFGGRGNGSPTPHSGRFGRRNQMRFGRGAGGFHGEQRSLPPPPAPPRMEGFGVHSDPMYHNHPGGPQRQRFSHEMPQIPQNYYEGGGRQFEPPMQHPPPHHWPRPPMQQPPFHVSPSRFSSPEHHWSYEGGADDQMQHQPQYEQQQQQQYFGGGPSPHMPMASDGSPSMPHMAPMPPPLDSFGPQRRGYPPALPVAPVAPMVRQHPYPGPPMPPPQPQLQSGVHGPPQAEYVPEYMGPAAGGMPMQHYWPNPVTGPEAYVPQQPPPETAQQQQPPETNPNQWHLQLDTESMQAALQSLTNSLRPELSRDFVPDLTSFDIKQLSQYVFTICHVDQF